MEMLAMTAQNKWLRLTLSVGLCTGISITLPTLSRPLWAQEETDPASTTSEPAESVGQADLDEALRIKVSGNGIRELNQAIELIETAIDKGLDEQSQDFAERMLSDSLMERASALMQMINARSISDPRVQQIRKLVTSDLRDVLAYGDPPPAAYLMLGKLQMLPEGDPREARRAISNYLKFEELPDDQRADALVLRARMMKDEQKAIADLEEAISLAPENTGYRLAMALYLRQAGKIDEALKAIEAVTAIDPTNGNAYILQGEIHRQQNQIEEALASFDKATELAPQAPAPYQNRGEIYRKMGEFEKSIAAFNEVLKLQPGVLLTLLHRSDAYMANGQLDEALADVEIILEKQPIVTAHRLRAEILTKLDRMDEAIEEIEQVASAMPDQADLKMQLALYYLVDKQMDNAIRVYSDVLDLQPGHFNALQARGDAYLNMGKHAEAIVDFNRALKLKPEDTTLLNNLAWVLATSPEDALRDGKRAVQLATQACELSEYKTPHILSTLAAAYAESGDFETALKWSQQSVDANDPEHREQLSKELESYRQGKPWRERQTQEEKTETPSLKPIEETPQIKLDGPATF
jgi:tetratricopeptide (TPR) repeat protein